MNTYDVAVVGGGAAGLSAALVLTRARRSVVVVDAGEPRNAPAAHMQGFLSRDGIPPADFTAAGWREVIGYGGHRVDSRIARIEGTASAGFQLALADGTSLGARRILVATGLQDRLPDIAGLRERWGRDLLHCPYCHGYEVRDQPLGVLGGTPDAAAHALLLRQWSADVVYFPHTDVPTADQRTQLAARGICVVDGRVASLVVENDRLLGIKLDDGRVITRAAAFVRPQRVPNADLLTALGCRTDDRGLVVADGAGHTSVPGVWVAGNVSNPQAQVITAAGEGSAAAIDINGDLVEEEVLAAVHAYH